MLRVFRRSNKEKNNTIPAIQKLKRAGYRIVATTVNPQSVSLEELPLEKGKLAVLFGTELTGLTEEALDLSDEFVTIPMVGFTDSYNISVSAAIILYSLTRKLHRSSLDWELSPREKEEVLLDWLKTTIKKSDSLIDAFRSKKKQQK